MTRNGRRSSATGPRIYAAEPAISRHKRTSRFRIIWLLLLLCLTMLIGVAWKDTFGTPVVRRTTVEVRGLPAGETSLRIALISDIHMGGPDMTPERLSGIVRQINAFQPDIVMLAGDMMAHRALITKAYAVEDAIAPLTGLKAPLGVVAVPGNHDHISGLPLMDHVMEDAGIKVLANTAEQIGPLAVGGFDGASQMPRKLAVLNDQLRGLTGPRIVLTHSPDIFAQLPSSIALTLAGHTHCGQIVWPWGYAPYTASRYGQRYACGRVDENGKVLVTSAGLGTSGIPLRLFAPSDIWIIDLRPPSDPSPGGPSIN